MQLCILYTWISSYAQESRHWYDTDLKRKDVLLTVLNWNLPIGSCRVNVTEVLSVAEIFKDFVVFWLMLLFLSLFFAVVSFNIALTKHSIRSGGCNN